MRDSQIKRIPMGEAISVPFLPECGPWCPPEGHRVRLEEPLDNEAWMHATNRVRVLHAVQSIRRQTVSISDGQSIGHLILSVSNFQSPWGTGELDCWTLEQLVPLTTLMSWGISRALTGRMMGIRIYAYSLGLRHGLHAPSQ